MNIEIKFRNDEQKQFYYHKERDGHFGGGFGNGKTYVACQRAFVHLATFGNYGMAIARLKYKVLKATTMKTFWKICPKELVYRHDENDGFTILTNKSFIYWMHLDAVDEDDVKGLEVNSELIDQGEELDEQIVSIFNARVGRWDQAVVPDYLLVAKVNDKQVKEIILRYQKENAFKNDDKIKELLWKFSSWPKNAPFNDRYRVPNYFDCLSNPPEEGELHWTWRWFYPESKERLPNSFHITRKTQDELNDAGSISRVLNKDQEFIDRYYLGKVGSPRAIIHTVSDQSIIRPKNYSKEVFETFLKKLFTRGALTRALDHGETGVTACGWEATLDSCHIFYREYYVNGELIGHHRSEIAGLSNLAKEQFNIEEEYIFEIADPQIFKKEQQKRSGFFSVADEYADTDEIEEEVSPPIFWERADNNEYATRNRISELLKPSSRFKHPITGECPAPGIYFIEADADIYPFGIKHAIVQTRGQKRLLLGSINGKNIFSEERDEKIADHAYDYVRYIIARHNQNKKDEQKSVPKRSFAYFNALLRQNPDFVPASGQGGRMKNIYGPDD